MQLQERFFNTLGEVLIFKCEGFAVRERLIGLTGSLNDPHRELAREKQYHTEVDYVVEERIAETSGTSDNGKFGEERDVRYTKSTTKQSIVVPRSHTIVEERIIRMPLSDQVTLRLQQIAEFVVGQYVFVRGGKSQIRQARLLPPPFPKCLGNLGQRRFETWLQQTKSSNPAYGLPVAEPAPISDAADRMQANLVKNGRCGSAVIIPSPLRIW